jgi:hypothetical protein
MDGSAAPRRLLWIYVKWLPYTTGWVNVAKTANYAAFVYICCVNMALQFPPASIK